VLSSLAVYHARTPAGAPNFFANRLSGSPEFVTYNPRPSAITTETVYRIKLDMTEAQVEAILGGPARDETDGTALPTYFAIGGEPMLQAEWIARDSAIRIGFYEGRVVSYSIAWGQPAILQRTWDRLGL
jgi:hypothetical protein